MWAHATPSGLRSPQTSSNVTPRVFLRLQEEGLTECALTDWSLSALGLVAIGLSHRCDNPAGNAL